MPAIPAHCQLSCRGRCRPHRRFLCCSMSRSVRSFNTWQEVALDLFLQNAGLSIIACSRTCGQHAGRLSASANWSQCDATWVATHMMFVARECSAYPALTVAVAEGGMLHAAVEWAAQTARQTMSRDRLRPKVRRALAGAALRVLPPSCPAGSACSELASQHGVGHAHLLPFVRLLPHPPSLSSSVSALAKMDQAHS